MNSRKTGKRKSWRYRYRTFKRNRLYPLWQYIRWPFIGVILLFGLSLGYIGFYIYSRNIGEEVTVLDLIYRSIQLIGIHSGDVEGKLPWQLEVARFLVPLVAGYMLFQALIAIFQDQWQQLKVRFLRNHVVICGLGERGLKFAEEFLEDGYQVVVVEEDESNAYINLIREQGASVNIGDASDEYTLRRAGVHKARYLVAVTSDDGTNAEIALCARNLSLLSRRCPLTVYIHIVDLELCHLLSGWCFAATETDLFRLEFFNVLARGAQILLKEYSPFEEQNRLKKKAPRILIVGLGMMGRSLVVQAARTWWAGYADKGKQLRVAVIDKAAERKLELLQLRYPKLEEACCFEVWQMNDNEPEFEKGNFLFDEKGSCDLDYIYLCFDDDVHVLVKALILHRKTKKDKVPIVVRMRRAEGLANLIKDNHETLDFDQIHPFSLLNKTCTLESLLGGSQESLARSIHEDYIEQQQREGATVKTNPSMANWDDLPEELKESNRSQAAHIEDKLKKISCGIQPLTDWDQATFEFSVEEVDLLAKMEHMRWYNERKRQGWKYKPGPKNVNKKTSPYMLPWEDLPEEVKEYNRNTVRKLPFYMARAGYQIYRRKQNDKL